MIVVVPVRCYERACGWHGFVEPAGSAKCPSCAGLLVPARERFEQLEAIRAHVARELGDGFEVVGVYLGRLGRFRLDVRAIGVDAIAPPEVSPAEVERISAPLLATVVRQCRHRATAAAAELGA